MPLIPVAEWIPDAADLGNPGSVTIKNAVPLVNSYGPVKTLGVLTTALTARPRGAVEAVDSSSNFYNYAGDASKLYQLSSTTWNDVSKLGGYSTGTEEIWEFARYKNKMLAVNWNDNPQQITFGGTVFSDLTTAFKARHIAVVRDHVVAGNTNDATDGDVRDRIRWSASGDETDWTVSPTTGADSRNLGVGGGIQRIVGGQYGVIVSERSTFRMTFSGSPTWFQIDEVLPGVGALSPGSVAQLGDTVYFWSEQGFVALTSGTSAAYPGAGKVDKWLRNDLDEDHLHRISSVVDPTSARILWAYPGSGNVDGRPNRIAVYDRMANKWSLIEQDVELIWRAGGIANTLEQVDTVSSNIDTLNISLDAKRWKGGAPQLAAFNSDFKHGFFDGAEMTATIETKETEIHAGHKTQLNAFRPLIDGGTVTAEIGTRDRQTDNVSYTSTLSQSSTGRFTKRSNARYHRFRLNITGSWNDAIGVQVEPHDARKAGRR